MTKIFSIKNIIIILFFLSGISGLIYEIIWSRLLSNILGSSIYAITIVISVFMAGLAFGSLFFGNIIDKVKISSFRVYAFIEIGIAIIAMISYLILPFIQNLYHLLFNLIESRSILLNLMRLLASFIVLFIPTFLIGATLPVLSKSFIKQQSKIGSNLGFLYGINTLGGVFGIFFTSFYFIENIGMQNTYFIAIFINLSIGVTVLLRYKNWESRASKIDSKVVKLNKHKKSTDFVIEKSLSSRLYWVILIAYSLSGLTALAFEVLWTRSLIFFIGSSTYAFSIILLNFLIGITTGSFVGSKISDRLKKPITTFAIFEIIIGISAVFSIFIFKQISNEMAYNLSNTDPIFLGSLKTTLPQIFLKTLYIVFPSTFIMGILFPIIGKIYIREFNSLGKSVGKIYFSNTVGTILGSIIATFIMIPFIGVSYSLLFFAIINIVLGYVIVVFCEIKLNFKIILFIFPLMLIGLIIFQNPFIKSFKSDTEQYDDKVLFYKEDVDATVKVYQDKEGFKSMSVNGMMIGGSQIKSLRKEIMLAHLPMLFHANPKKILAVGLGTGITLNEISLYNPKILHCVEIVDAVRVAAKYFKSENGGIIENGKADIYIEDGRNFVDNSKEKYDVIIDDSMLRRESAGNGPLYANEYYKSCYDHLEDDGIFCQWLPLYLQKSTYQTVLKTLKNNFSYVTLWYMGHAAVIQIATKNKLNVDISELIKKIKEPIINQHLQTVEMNYPESIIRTLLLDNQELMTYSDLGDINSDNNPIVEFRVPKQSGSELVFSENLLEMSPLRPKTIPSFNYSNSVEAKQLEENLKKSWDSFHYILAGSIFSHSGDSKNSLKNYLKALEINPKDQHAIYFLNLSDSEPLNKRSNSLIQIGNFYTENKNYNKAIEFFEKAISLDSLSVQGYNLLANLYFDLGQVNKAMELGEKSIKIIPNNSTLLFNLGTYYEDAKIYSKAFDIYSKVIKLDPTNKYAVEGMEDCREKLSGK